MSTSAALDRRRLLCLGACGMVSVSLSGLSACGGGDAADPDGGGGTGDGGGGGGTAGSLEGNGVAAAGTPGAPVSAGERSAALDSVSTKVMALVGTDGHYDAAAAARQLAASSAFQRVGVSAATGSAWAVFTDGRRLLIPNQPAAGGAAPAAAPRKPASARRQPAADADALPGLLAPRQFRHLDMFGELPLLDIDHVTRRWVNSDTLPDLRRIAAGRGFDVVNLSDRVARTDGPETGVEGLRQVGGDGVLFINGYGGEVTADDFGCGAISTTTPVSDAGDAAYAGDLDAARLTYMMPVVRVGNTWGHRKVYAITPEFARFHRWSFPPNSIAILNVSGGGQTRHWQSLLGAAGMDALMTWDRPVLLERMLAFVEDLMHLCLATNTFAGERFDLEVPPRLRAYGIGETVEFLMAHGLTAEPFGADQIAYFPSNQPTRFVNTLVPTTAYALIDDTRGTWQLNGLFGRHDGGHVASGKELGRFAEPLLAQAAEPPVKGIEQMLVNEWQGDTIHGDLGDFDCGYLQVINGGRSSNVVRITRWKIPFRLTTTISGGLKLETRVEVQLRADIRGWRLHFREVAGSRNLVAIPLFNRRGAGADYTASGEIAHTVDGVTTTLSWLGSGRFGEVPGASTVSFGATLDWVRRVCTGTLLALGGTHQQREVRRRGQELLSDRTIDVPFVVSAPASPEVPLELQFDSHWDLAAGSYRLAPIPKQLLGERTQETVLSWPQVSAEFPPSSDEGT